MVSTLARGRVRAHVGPGPELREVRFDGEVAIDAIMLAVRDRQWRSVEGECVAEETDVAGPTAATVRRHWRYRLEGATVEAHWTAELRPDRVEVSAELSADVDVAVNRAGLVVLHPLELAGCPVSLRHRWGTGHGRFPVRVAPTQVFGDLTGMAFELGLSGRVELDLIGGVYETEDHRNWGDAGWKTYSPPLDDPLPQLIRAGEPRRHSVVVRFRPSTAEPPRPAPATSDRVGELRVGPRTGRRLPQLGWGAGTAVRPAARRLIDGRGFLYAEVVEGDRADERLAAAVAQAVDHRVPLRLTLVAGSDALPGWAASIGALPAIASVAVIDPRTHTSGPALTGRFQQLLGAGGPAVAGGTWGYLAELGRAPDCDAGADLVQLSVSAEVHHRDSDLIMDTTRALRDVAGELRRRAGHRLALVAPLTLAQRLSVHQPATPDVGVWSSRFQPDPRAGQGFGAAWLAAATAGLAAVDEIAAFSIEPGAGLLDEDGAVTPAGALVARLAGLAGSPLHQVSATRPRRTTALAVTEDDGVTVWVVNRRSAPDAVVVEHGGRSVRVELQPYGIETVRFG